ncbi:MAG: deoxyribose-phosphate aldolase [Bacteroidetes bacterium]|nr:deoxyribose-phosphate aldolase [Bacteroidota bacterium]
MFSFSLLSDISFDRLPAQMQLILGNKRPYEESIEQLRDILSFIDLTPQEGSDNQEQVLSLCEKAVSFGEQGLPLPAAVCIYPPFIATAKRALQAAPIKIATTPSAFPCREMPVSVRLDKIRHAIEDGADEIDVAISHGTLLAREYNKLFREVDAMRELSSHRTLKIILEPGELQTPENIARASEIVIEAGADFITSCAGSMAASASDQAVFVMLLVIRECHRKNGKKIGIKLTGGISDPEKALDYYWLVEQVLGRQWLTNKLFRLGANSLADRIVEIIL